MVVTKMKKIKFQCRKCDCWSLICGIKKKNKKKIREYKSIHTFTKRIEVQKNDKNNKNNSKVITIVIILVLKIIMIRI